MTSKAIKNKFTNDFCPVIFGGNNNKIENMILFSIILSTKDPRFSYVLSNNSWASFPANIWIFKLRFCLVFAIKMHLGNTYGLLNLLEFKYNKFESHCQAEYEFRNSNVGGKGCSRIIWEDIRESRIFNNTYIIYYILTNVLRHSLVHLLYQICRNIV